jgi:hypothetical protein
MHKASAMLPKTAIMANRSDLTCYGAASNNHEG